MSHLSYKFPPLVASLLAWHNAKTIKSHKPAKASFVGDYEQMSGTLA